MEEPKIIPQTLTDWMVKKLNEERAGETLTVNFPPWARQVFVAALNAANDLAWSPSQVALFALTEWLENRGHLRYSPPPPEKKPALPEDVETRLREAMRCVVSAADATNKTHKNAAIHEALTIIRNVVNGVTTEGEE